MGQREHSQVKEKEEPGEARAREDEGVLACVGQRGERSVLFLGLVGCLAGALITFVSGDTTYAVLLLLLGLVMGAALWKREVT